jgi:hypothetical protein
MGVFNEGFVSIYPAKKVKDYTLYKDDLHIYHVVRY